MSFHNHKTGKPTSAGPIPDSSSLAGESLAGERAQGAGQYLIARELGSNLDLWINRISDSCSSILVKEARQAIKSRQFLLTFNLLLFLVVVWTFFALSPGRDYYETQSLGAFMLCGFLWILGLPLVLIIPYTTFRSVAQEYEDGTIEMVLITTMEPYQIVAGKLGSAMLQVLVYMSVLAPCIAFCYLLRGVDISQIYYAIAGGGLVSFGLCCLAIALASAAETKRSGQVLSVFLILILLFCVWGWCFSAYGICYEPIPTRHRKMTELMLTGPVLAWSSTAVLLLLAASAKIGFSSSNRSTSIRICVFVQAVLFLGWLLGVIATVGSDQWGYGLGSLFSMHYLLLVGALMVATQSGMTKRVRRTLPVTFFQRSMFSLFMPGPGRAFLFVVGLAGGLSIALALALVFNKFLSVENDFGNLGRRMQIMPGDVDDALFSILINFTFFLFFFCLMFLISRFFAWRADNRTPFVIEMGASTIVVVFLTILASYAIAPRVFWDTSASGFEFTQVLNWYRANYCGLQGDVIQSIAYVMLVGAPTAVMFFFCMRYCGPELLETQVDVPERILEDEERQRQIRQGNDPEEETIDEIFAAVRDRQEI